MNKSFNKPNLSKYKGMTKIKTGQEEDEGVPEHIFLPYYESQSTSRLIKFYLDEGIREPKYYRNLLHTIETLGEGDIVEIMMNSYGGHFDSAVALLHAFRTTEAHVHCCIQGTAASAGSLIALAADSVEVGPYASLMVHAASWASAGKQSDIISHAMFVDQQVKDVANDVYQDFLTEKELEDVWLGKEMWFKADEIIERLERRAELQEKRHKKMMQAVKKQQREAMKSYKTKNKIEEVEEVSNSLE